MRITSVLATGATAALLVAPGWAVASGGPSANAGDHPSAHAQHQQQAADDTSTTTATPGPQATQHQKAKAYGVYCAKESRKHVAGEHGTAFSQCVTAMARAATGKAKSPTTACRTLSRKHVAGQHGTPYSQCVSAAAKLLRDQRDGGDDSAGDASS